MLIRGRFEDGGRLVRFQGHGVITGMLSRRGAYSASTIEEVLGQGGFGTVFKASHSESDHLRVHLPSQHQLCAKARRPAPRARVCGQSVTIVRQTITVTDCCGDQTSSPALQIERRENPGGGDL